jgi:small-conductance mechanosensitive channel
MLCSLTRQADTIISAWSTRDIVRLLTGGGALLAGLSLLATVPLTAVLIILGAMGCVLGAAAKLSGSEVRR